MHQIGFSIQANYIPHEDDSVRLLFKVTKGLDYSKLYQTYSTKGRNPAIEPAILFRMIIYMLIWISIFRAEILKKACNRDINFIWLL